MAGRHHFIPGLGPASPARGAAALAVVMVLFFIISLVAAYTSRNLIFEQRTSANQYRSTLAFEAADAGVEWALARLNAARMSDDCTPLTAPGAVASPPQPSFRERYLSIDPVTGAITPVANRFAGCVFNGAGWSCHCPEAGNPAPAFAAGGEGPYSAFWLRFVAVPERPGVVQVQVNSCTRFADSCLRFDREAQAGDGVSSVYALLALKSGIVAPPAAALTARGPVSFGVGGTLAATNTDPASGGITIHGGRSVDLATATLVTLPGTPPARSVIVDDPALTLADLSPPLSSATPANIGANRMFNSVFGLWPATYFAQPAIAEVACEGGCNAAAVTAAASLYPGRPLHLTGSGPLSADANIGSAAEPLMLVVDGRVEFTGTAATLYGAVYSRAATWVLPGLGAVVGAAVAEGDLQVTGTPALIYDASVLTRLRTTTGSFVKVPGGWRDFQP